MQFPEPFLETNFESTISEEHEVYANFSSKTTAKSTHFSGKLNRIFGVDYRE